MKFSWNEVFLAIGGSIIFTGLLYENSPFQIITALILNGSICLLYNLIKRHETFLKKSEVDSKI
ncbi:MAG: hypothetical protein IIC67_01790 [Thaumarchaeota archaeon]|nr:hypothetical protein [Nitrososphaerota archaeon]